MTDDHALRPRRWHVAAAGAALAFALFGCGGPGTEQRLRASIDALGEAVEARDASAIGELLTDDFIGPGGMDRRGARRLATLRFMRHERVGLVRGPLEIRLHGDHATVRFHAVLAGGSASPLPDAAARYDVETGWRLQRGEWRLASARW